MHDPVDVFLDHLAQRDGDLDRLTPLQIAEFVWLRTWLEEEASGRSIRDFARPDDTERKVAEAHGASPAPTVELSESPSPAEDVRPVDDTPAASRGATVGPPDDSVGDDEGAAVVQETGVATTVPAHVTSASGPVDAPPSHAIDADDAASGRLAGFDYGRETRVGNALALGRVLHRLARTRAARDRLVLDVDETVRASAAAQVLVPVLKPLTVRSTRLLLLWDASAQLAPWRPTMKQVASLVTTLPSFESVQVLVADLSRRDRATFCRTDASLRPLGTPGTLTEHVLPGRDHLVAVVTDGLARGVSAGALGDALAALPTGTVVTWWHPWPERAWWRSGLAALRGTRPRPVERPDRVVGPALAVVTFDENGLKQLEPFARGRGVAGAAGWRLPTSAALESGRQRRVRPAAVPVPPPREVIRRFVETAEPSSVRLAALASVVPGRVDLSLLQAIGERFVPHGVSRFNLAEVLTSGAFERAERGDELIVRVRAPFREPLATLVPPSTVRAVLAFLHERYGTGEPGRRAAGRLHLPVRAISRVLDVGRTTSPEDVVLRDERAFDGWRVLEATLGLVSPGVSLQQVVHRTLDTTQGEAAEGGAPSGPIATGAIVRGTVRSISAEGEAVLLTGPAGWTLHLVRERIGGLPVLDLHAAFAKGDEFEVRVGALEPSTLVATVEWDLDAQRQYLVTRFAVDQVVDARLSDGDDALLVGGVAARLEDGPLTDEERAVRSLLARVTGFDLVSVALRARREEPRTHEAAFGVVRAVVVEAKRESVVLAAGDARYVMPRRDWAMPLVGGDEIDVVVTGEAHPGHAGTASQLLLQVRRFREHAHELGIGATLRATIRRRADDFWILEAEGLVAVLHGSPPAQGADGLVDVHVRWTIPVQGRVIVSADEVRGAYDQSAFRPGSRWTGTVVEARPFGVVVNLEGEDGVVPSDALRWELPPAPVGLCAPGERLDVVVADSDPAAGRLELSCLPLRQNPFLGLEQRCPPGTLVHGLVRAHVEGGALVEVEDVLAFLPWGAVDPESVSPGELLPRVGTEVIAHVVAVDLGRRRMELDARPELDPREGERFAAEWHVGRRVRAVVVEVGVHTAICRVEGKVPAKLPMRSPSAGDAREVLPALTAGDEIEAYVRRVDAARRRVVLDLHPVLDFDAVAAQFAVGDPISGVVGHVEPYGAFLRPAGFGFDILLPASLAMTTYVDPRSYLQAGQRIEGWVHEIHSSDRRVTMRTLPLQPKDDALVAFVEANSGTEDLEGVVVGTVPAGTVVRVDAFVGLWTPDRDASTQARLPSEMGSRVSVRIRRYDVHGGVLFLRTGAAQNLRIFEDFVARHAIGDRLTGIVVNNTKDFGVFVQVEGLTGLLHHTRAGVSGENLREAYPQGAGVEVVLDSIDRVQARVQFASAAVATQRPRQETFAEFAALHPVGTELVGTVVRVVEAGGGVLVDLGALHGLLPAAATMVPIDAVRRAYSVGDVIDVRVEELAIEQMNVRLRLLHAPGSPGALRGFLAAHDRYDVVDVEVVVHRGPYALVRVGAVVGAWMRASEVDIGGHVPAVFERYDEAADVLLFSSLPPHLEGTTSLPRSVRPARGEWWPGTLGESVDYGIFLVLSNGVTGLLRYHNATVGPPWGGVRNWFPPEFAGPFRVEEVEVEPELRVRAAVFPESFDRAAVLRRARVGRTVEGRVVRSLPEGVAVQIDEGPTAIVPWWLVDRATHPVADSTGRGRFVVHRVLEHEVVIVAPFGVDRNLPERSAASRLLREASRSSVVGRPSRRILGVLRGDDGSTARAVRKMLFGSRDEGALPPPPSGIGLDDPLDPVAARLVLKAWVGIAPPPAPKPWVTWNLVAELLGVEVALVLQAVHRVSGERVAGSDVVVMAYLLSLLPVLYGLEGARPVKVDPGPTGPRKAGAPGDASWTGDSLWVLSSRYVVPKVKLVAIAREVLGRDVPWAEPLAPADADAIVAVLEEQPPR